MEIPYDATHVILPNPLDFCQRPDFAKFAFEFYGPESGEPFYAWYFWNTYYRQWMKDTATLYSDLKKKGRLITRAEFIAQNNVQKSES